MDLQRSMILYFILTWTEPYMYKHLSLILFNIFKICNETTLICFIEAQSRNTWKFRKKLEPSVIKLLALLFSLCFPIYLFILPTRIFFPSLDQKTNIFVCIITEVMCYNSSLVNWLIGPNCKFREIEDSELTWKGIHCWFNQRWPIEWATVDYNGS